MQFKKFIKQNYHFFVITLLVTVIIGINLQVNKYIVGLDNISPYFNSSSIISKALENQSKYLISFLPQILLLPIFELLKAVNIPTWLINQMYIFSSLAIGVFGVSALAKRVSQYFYKKESKDVYIFAGILTIASLCTYWIFNQPNFFFVAAFASAPWIILLLLDLLKQEKVDDSPLVCRIFKYIFYVYILILFLQTTMNLVVFFTILLSIFLIVWVIRSMDTKFEKGELIKLGIYVSFPVLFYLLVIQIILIATGNNSCVLLYIYRYYSDIVSNPLTEGITNDLRASGYIRNTFVNNLLFSNSWMETHTPNSALFQNYSLYNSGLIKYLGLIPFFLSVYALFLFSPKKSKSLGKLHLLLFLSVLFMSSLVLRVTENVPVLDEIFRWSSSKFWILYLIPFVILGAISLKKVFKKQILKFAVIFLLLIYIFPIFQGELVSKELIVNIPQEYFTLNEKLDRKAEYYYLPAPNSQYFYMYDWGYFGSDIVGYITDGNYYDVGVVSYFNNYERYQELIEKLKTCKGDIDGQIIYDSNLETETEEVKNCLETRYSVVEEIDNIRIYKSR